MGRNNVRRTCDDQQIFVGKLVIYSHGSGYSRLPLESQPILNDESIDSVGTGPAWPFDETGIILEIMDDGKYKTAWVKVLISTGIGWCNLDEVIGT